MISIELISIEFRFFSLDDSVPVFVTLLSQ